MILEFAAPRLLGPALMVAGAIIVKGYTDVGDGFSAGVIVALAVALRYVTLGPDEAERTLPVLRHAGTLAICGLLVSLSVAFVPVAFGDPIFTHYPAPGVSVVKIGTLELITAVLFDLGLFVLVAGSLIVLIHHLSHLVRDE